MLPRLFGCVTVASALLIGCERAEDGEGTFDAGEQVGKGLNAAGELTDAVGNKVGDTLENAGDAIEEAVDQPEPDSDETGEGDQDSP
jgi:hypothetical protein